MNDHRITVVLLSHIERIEQEIAITGTVAPRDISLGDHFWWISASTSRCGKNPVENSVSRRPAARSGMHAAAALGVPTAPMAAAHHKHLFFFFVLDPPFSRPEKL